MRPLRYGDLDAATIERLKSHVIDTLGCGIAAAERPVRVCREIAQSVQGAATIIGTTRMTSPDLAAFAKGGGPLLRLWQSHLLPPLCVVLSWR